MPIFANAWEALRHSFFTVASLISTISTISTTGFSTVDFDLWSTFSKIFLLGIMFIRACAESMGGEIKASRIIVVVKLIFSELSIALHPKQVKKITVDGEVVERDVVRSIYGYMFIYIAIFALSIILIFFDGADLITNFTAVTATVSNVGSGLAGVGPTKNYAFFSPLSKLTLTFRMLAGRLELFPMLLLFVQSTRKK